MNKLYYIFLLFITSAKLFSQEYEIAWEKDIGGSYAQFSKDGEFIYVAGGNTINKYRSSDGSFVSSFDNSGVPNIYGMNISSSGNFIATRDGGGGSNIWDVKAEKAIKQVTNMVNGDILNDSIAISIFDLKNGSKKIALYNFFTSKEVKSTITDNLQVILKVSHNGKMFATASISDSKYYLTLWDTETLTEIKRFELEAGDSFSQLKFSWNDKFVGISTSAPSYYASIFDLNSLKELTNSKIFDKWLCSFFDFTNENIIFHYTDIIVDTTSLVSISLNNLNIVQRFNLQVLPLITSSNNLIFTGNALLRPKTVGVSENERNKILISPNPASDYIEISQPSEGLKPSEGYNIEIFNIFGEKVEKTSLSVQNGQTGMSDLLKIDISNLAPGVYFIKIADKFEKFVKL